MIIAISRFRVRNGMEAEVKKAFAARPHLVDSEPGFLGMEVFIDHADQTIFHLVTRWTDIESYERWHASDAHTASHAGIPLGLKLDPEYTQVTVMDRLPDSAVLEQSARDSSALLSQQLSASENYLFLAATHTGAISVCNLTAARALGFASVQEALGENLWNGISQEDAAPLRARIADGSRKDGSTLTVTFSDQSETTVPFRCFLDVHPGTFFLAGERADSYPIYDEVLQDLNNRLAVLAREQAQVAKALARAKEELEEAVAEREQTYWHMRKIQEVLPICLGCGNVKTGATTWESARSFLQEHAAFLSHGYCPSCSEAVAAQWGLRDSAGEKG